jgi:hypothetical protein
MMEVSCQLQAPATLSPRKQSLESIAWAPELVWTLWKREKSFVPTGIKPQMLDLRTRSLVAVPTGISMLLQFCHIRERLSSPSSTSPPIKIVPVLN